MQIYLSRLCCDSSKEVQVVLSTATWQNYSNSVLLNLSLLLGYLDFNLGVSDATLALRIYHSHAPRSSNEGPTLCHYRLGFLQNIPHTGNTLDFTKSMALSSFLLVYTLTKPKYSRHQYQPAGRPYPNPLMGPTQKVS